MIRYLFFLVFLSSFSLSAQWSVSSGITSGRNDDITFLNDSLGYVAGGNRGSISRSTDGGNSWVNVFTGGSYLRSIKFIDESTGFCGSLDSILLMTSDSGATWVDISTTISPRPKGVCGISVADDSTIYGCGIYNQPAFIIKSTNRGGSWNYIDMSAYASALVEVHFVNKDTGWVTGRAVPATDGGVILYTTDGGINWTPLFKTFTNLDYVWKIQSPDGKSYFASVSSMPPTSNTSFLKSTDGGLNWTQSIVDSAWFDIQMIGFVDSLHGWTGGANQLFETTDGGATWSRVNNTIPLGSYYNRFLILNDTTAFISGGRIYKYTGTSRVITSITSDVSENVIHRLEVIPNPTEKLGFQVIIGNATNATIQLLNLRGEVVEDFYDGKLSKGEYSFTSVKIFQPQLLFLVMRTNEGLYTEKVVIN